MKLRQKKEDKSRFYGCGNYPKCDATLPCHQKPPFNLAFENPTEIIASNDVVDQTLGITRDERGMPRAVPAYLMAPDGINWPSASTASAPDLTTEASMSDRESEKTTDSETGWSFELIRKPKKQPTQDTTNELYVRLRERMQAGLTKDQAISEMMQEVTSEEHVKYIIDLATEGLQ